MREGTISVLLGLILLKYLPLLVIGAAAIAIPIYLIVRHNKEQSEKEKNLEAQRPPEEAAVDAVKARRLPLMEEWADYVRSQGIDMDWCWPCYDSADIIFIKDGEGIDHVGKVWFAETGDPDCYDQPRVTRVYTVIKDTEIGRDWPVPDMKRIPLESIEKNIANSFKNDKNLRAVLEEAHSQCLMQGYGMIELDKIDLDFEDNRVKKEFLRRCLTSGNFKSAHLQSNGHEVKVFAGNSDPLPY